MTNQHRDLQTRRATVLLSLLMIIGLMQLVFERKMMFNILSNVSNQATTKQKRKWRNQFHLAPDEFSFRKVKRRRKKHSVSNVIKNSSAIIPQVEAVKRRHHISPPRAPVLNPRTEAPALSLPEEVIWSEKLVRDLNNENEASNPTTRVLVSNGVYGQVQENGKLVVNIDHTHMFWKDAQIKLCQLLTNMTLSNDENFTNPLLSARPLLNATIDCKELKKDEGLGQGNWITALYCTRIAAAKAKVDFQFQCTDGNESSHELLLPWFAGFQPAPNNRNNARWPFTGEEPTRDQACEHRYPHIRVDKMADRIIDEVQRMAVTLVGSQNDSIRYHPSIPLNQPPMIPNVVLDDIAIHFRCGDVMGGARRSDFGMIKFTEYLKHISPLARSIGILTQPFEANRNRRADSRRAGWCKSATLLLMDTLQTALPQARITIHNGINETLPLAYARLAMANQSFTSLSSFGIFPIIGTFGHGYFQQGNRGINPFAAYLPGLFPNLHMMTGPKLATGTMSRMNLSSILDWFVS